MPIAKLVVRQGRKATGLTIFLFEEIAELPMHLCLGGFFVVGVELEVRQKVNPYSVGEPLFCNYIKGRKLEMKFKLISAILLVLVFSTFSFAAKPVDPDPVPPNPVIVAKDGGHFTDLIAAMDSILDASVANPYLVKIMPGVYDLGETPLYVKDYVSIQGSGAGTTKIVGSVNDFDYPYSVGVVNMGSNIAVSDLTVENVDSDPQKGSGSVAIASINAQNTTIKNATLKGKCSLHMLGSDLKLRDLDIYVIGEINTVGIRSIGEGSILSKYEARDIYIEMLGGDSTLQYVGSMGISNYGSDVTIDGLTIMGTQGNLWQRGLRTYGFTYYGSFYLTNGYINVDNGNIYNIGIDADPGTIPMGISKTKIISSGVNINPFGFVATNGVW